MEIQSLFSRKYELVKSSRRVLFDYCKTVKPEDFINQNTSFGRGGSMRNLLVHIANTYQYWILEVVMQQKISYSEYQSYPDLESVTHLFETVDVFMDAFLKSIDPSATVIYEIAGSKGEANMMQLFTHVITHEYHHKGQILSISRHLGYIPVDTDIMR